MRWQETHTYAVNLARTLGAMKPSRFTVVAALAGTILAMVHPSVLSACNVVNGKAYGDCADVTVRKSAKPHLAVHGATTESAIVSGATIYADGSLHLSGISESDITVHKGGRLFVGGVVNATVRNLGGEVEVEGMVSSLFTTGGKVVVGGTVGTISGSGAVQFRRGAVLGGVPFKQQTLR